MVKGTEAGWSGADRPDGQDNYEVKIPRWVNRDTMWDRFQSAPDVVKLAISQLLDRDFLDRLRRMNISGAWQVDIKSKIDKGRSVLRPDVSTLINVNSKDNPDLNHDIEVRVY